METRRYQKEEISEVVDALKSGKVIAFPTDTVFGLGVAYGNEEALHHLKHAKIRPEEKPIPMMVASLKQIHQVAKVSEKAEKLIQAFMPGAFTIVLEKKDSVAEYVTNGMKTIAIRMPDDTFVLSLMEQLDRPLMVSSANISAQHACQTSDDVLKQLDGRIDGIVEGESKSSVASTIVSVIDDEVKILRNGKISEDAIRHILQEEIK